MLSSSRGQANFRGLETSRPRPRTWPSRPRPRTSKCVLEDVLEAKDVLEDSTSGYHQRIILHVYPMAIHLNKRFCGGRKAGPAPLGAFRDRARQITACAPPSEKYVPPNEGCASKESNRPVPLECISGPASPKILLVLSQAWVKSLTTKNMSERQDEA